MNSNQLKEDEYSSFYKNYVTILGEINLLEVLNNSLENLINTLKNLPEEKLQYRYEEGKWTIKELIQHIIDAERVLSYRALRFARNDATNLQGFDENWYVKNSNGNDRDFDELLNEFSLVRKATILLFKSFSNEMLTNTVSANGSVVSVRALGFIIAGHQIHHLNIIKEKYL
ncbi:DinB family protein [Lutibacter sp.]